MTAFGDLDPNGVHFAPVAGDGYCSEDACVISRHWRPREMATCAYCHGPMPTGDCARCINGVVETGAGAQASLRAVHSGRTRMTLIEFLLARIADDEGRPPAEFATALQHKRMLAECEAKRRIVEHHGAGESECGACWWGEGDCQTMRLLATPYADHPDYREEWKP